MRLPSKFWHFFLSIVNKLENNIATHQFFQAFTKKKMYWFLDWLVFFYNFYNYFFKLKKKIISVLRVPCAYVSLLFDNESREGRRVVRHAGNHQSTCVDLWATYNISEMKERNMTNWKTWPNLWDDHCLPVECRIVDQQSALRSVACMFKVPERCII